MLAVVSGRCCCVFIDLCRRGTLAGHCPGNPLLSRPIESIRRPVGLRYPAQVCVVMVIWAVLAVAIDATAAVPGVDESAPDFALRSADGKNLRLSEYRGKVVLLNFWTRSCGRCREQLDQLEQLYSTYGDAGVTVLSVAITDDPHHVDEIVAGLGLSFPVLYDDRKVAARLYEPSSIPLTLLIDPHGVVRYTHKKYRRGDEEIYREQLLALLSE
jgi:peroxiredoxin